MNTYFLKQRWLGIVTALFYFTGTYTPVWAKPVTHAYKVSPVFIFCHPLEDKGSISQGFNSTTHHGRSAYAYDLIANIGTPVHAVIDGIVLGVRDGFPDTGGGSDKISKFNYVMLEHEDRYRSAYVHLQQGFRTMIGIKAGDHIRQGQVIGYSGNSGWSSGPHLHIEIQRPGQSDSFTQTVPFRLIQCLNNR
jgi:murein DD-endopeptidase MepM/ murein hydrolase activator NlpD